MKQYGQQTASKVLGADKMIIDALNQTNLRKAFGQNGQYGSKNAIIFDASTKTLMYLTQFDSNADAIDVSKWLPMPTGDITANDWTAKTYNKGSLVMLTDSASQEVSFYLSMMNTVAGDTPGVSSKWFKIPTEGGSIALPMQIEYGSIDKTASLTDFAKRTISLTLNDIVTVSNTRIPTIQVLIRTAEDRYEIAYPEVKFTKGSAITCNTIFRGDLAKLHSEQNNVIITFI